jgi:proton glutamate symport protein
VILSVKKKKKSSPWKVFLAIILAIIIGSLLGRDASLWGISFYAVFDVIGTIFLNALMLVVVPLVSSSIISGISRIGSEGGFGRLGAKMFTFYLGTSLLAILIGLFYVNLISPGLSHHLTPTVEIADSALKQSLEHHQTAQAFIQVIISIVPPNIFGALARGEMLSLIFFSLLFGFCLSNVSKQSSAVLQDFFKAVFDTMIQVTHFVMKFLPYGVFCLIAKVFMTSGLESISSLVLFTLTVLSGLLTFVLIGLPLLLRFVAKVNPLYHFKAMAPALVTAFSTSSSSATLPITLNCVEKRSGVSNRIASIVIPLGTSINMSGSALYECVAAMFVAQVYGIDLSFWTQLTIVMMALISSIGVAGIPSASLVAVLIILKVVGLPAEGIGLFIAVDRILDMCRTTVNVFSDSCCAVLVAKSEGEKNVLTTDQFEEEA